MSTTQIDRLPVSPRRTGWADPTSFEQPESPLSHLTPEQVEQLGRELDAIHAEVYADLGEGDARYIRSVITLHRRLVLGARALLIGSRSKTPLLVGTPPPPPAHNPHKHED